MGAAETMGFVLEIAPLRISASVSTQRFPMPQGRLSRAVFHLLCLVGNQYDGDPYNDKKI